MPTDQVTATSSSVYMDYATCGPQFLTDELISANYMNYFHSQCDDKPWIQMTLSESYFITR